MKKIKILILLTILISCGGNPDNNKNKFEYKKIEKKDDFLDKKSKETVIILNSNDLMKFDKNVNSYIYCAGGYRSVIACSLIKKNGLKKLVNVKTGFSGIKNLI